MTQGKCRLYTASCGPLHGRRVPSAVVSDDVPKLLHDQYHLVASQIISPIVDLLTVARAVCMGDLDKYLILLVIALRTTDAQPTRELRLGDVLRGEVERYPSLFTNVRSVAESTGVPRETVRRKVRALVEAGWVSRTGDDLALTPYASQQLTPMRDAMFALARDLHRVVARVRRG